MSSVIKYNLNWEVTQNMFTEHDNMMQWLQVTAFVLAYHVWTGGTNAFTNIIKGLNLARLQMIAFI